MNLVLVELEINEFIFALFLKRDDDQRNEDVHKEEGKDDEEGDVEDCHLLLIVLQWTLVHVSSIH